MLTLFSQVDPLSGGAGWVGAGLLGCVMAWLCLKHLPDKDRQLATKDKVLEDTISTLLDRHETTEREQREAFTIALDKVVAHCKEEMDRIVGYWAERRGS